MRLSCLHTHTSFCDGAAEVEDYCVSARDKGFVSLGFSAHAPTPLATTWHLKAERLDAYIGAVKDAARSWGRELQVLTGLEVDYIATLHVDDSADGAFGPSAKRFTDLGLHYTIGSVHYLRGETDLFTVDGPFDEWTTGVERGFGGDPEAAAEEYWEVVGAMVEAGGFDLVGHLDLVKKNNRGDRTFQARGERYRRAAWRALDTIEAYKDRIVVEVNTGGMNRGTIQEPYPSLDLLKELRHREVRTTINADAHRPEHLDGHYVEAISLLKEAGYRVAYIMIEPGCWVQEAL